MFLRISKQVVLVENMLCDRIFLQIALIIVIISYYIYKLSRKTNNVLEYFRDFWQIENLLFFNVKFLSEKKKKKK